MLKFTLRLLLAALCAATSADARTAALAQDVVLRLTRPAEPGLMLAGRSFVRAGAGGCAA